MCVLKGKKNLVYTYMSANKCLFFAAGNFNYPRYGLCYINSMEKLPRGTCHWSQKKNMELNLKRYDD